MNGMTCINDFPARQCIGKRFMQMTGLAAVLILPCLAMTMGQAQAGSPVSPEVQAGEGLLQRQVSGKVSDRETSDPVSLVHVINKRTGDWTITGYQGEFVIMADEGDELAFVKDDYVSRVITLEDAGGALSISITKKPKSPESQSELLPKVTVYGKSYRADSVLLRREYERYFPSPPPTLDEAIGSDGSLDLNAYISRMMTPWDREFSQRLLEYEQKKYIDKVFTETRVKQVVPIEEKELEEFMRTCRPSYTFLVTATEYDLIKYIRDAYDLYRSAKYGETLRHGNRQ